MALDKHKILSELGNVVNQLQSADCGCMGKIFNNSHAYAPNTAPTAGAGDHRHGCCHCQRFNHCSAPCNGDVRSNMTSHYNNSCMGRCNPTKLYSDTYQYLNQNLMQPVVKEVYNDLKSLTPVNTVMNNQPNAITSSQGQTNLQVAQNKNIPYPNSGMSNANNQGLHIDPRVGGGPIGGVGDQIGGTSGYINGADGHANVGEHFNGTGGNMNAMNYNMNATTGNMGGMGGYMSGMGNQVNGGNRQTNAMENHINGMEGHISESANQLPGTGNPMPGMGGQMNGTGHMGGMNTYMSGVGGHTHEVGQNIVNMMMGGKKANTNDNPIEGGLTQPMVIDAPQSPHGQVGVIPIPAHANENGSNVAQMRSYNQHFHNNDGNSYSQMPVLNQTQPQIQNVDTNPLQQLAPKQKAYGQHAPGITKFNEMFPGVMQNFGGDLGFDPMAIAVQMNPANHQRAAIDTMTKLMNDNKADLNKMPNQLNSVQPTNLGYLQPNDGVLPSNVPLNQPQQSNIPNDQSSNNQSHVTNQQTIQNPYQQVYTTATPTPTINQQQLQQPQHFNVQDRQLTQQQYISMDPNLNTSNTLIQQPNHQENLSKYGMQSQILNSQTIPEQVTEPISFQMEKEPIFPANASPNQTYSNIKRHVNYTYNTLGQPIEMLPAKRYHIKDPGGPQTLSPQNVPVNAKPNPKMYSNVKGTVSKTSIMGNQPLGRNPSKNQLQHIYHQYGGSQSHTRQNILSHHERPSYSEGRLNIPQQREGRAMPNDQVPVEKIGGDTLLNKVANNDIKATAPPASGQSGDVPNTNKIGRNEVPEQATTLKTPKARNGLQDLVYTSYPTSTAWSFHGNARPSFVGRHKLRL